MQVDARDIDKLNAAINSLANMSGRSVDAVMRQAVPMIARSAARATGPGARFPVPGKNRPKRRITSNRYGRARQSKGIPAWADYRIEIWEQGIRGTSRKVFKYISAPQLGFFEKIPNRGVAKAAWFGAIPRELVGRTSGIAGGVRGAKRYSRGRLIRDRGNIVGAKLTNMVRYNQKAGPNAPEIAVQKTTNKLNKLVEREDKRIEREWRRRFRGGF